MLAKTKDALKLLNDLTSDGNVGNDYYQAPDFAASMNRNLVDFRPFFKAKENIWLITTGYKIRQAHDEAFCDLRACQLPYPVEVEYGKAKRAAKDVLYSCNGIENKYTGWGKHTQERIDEAWATLEADTIDIGAPPPSRCGGCRAIHVQLFVAKKEET